MRSFPSPAGWLTERHSGVRLAVSLAPLARRAYRLLWIGQTVSSAGDALVQVAVVFAILHVGGTAADIGYVAALQTVTRAGFILAGGCGRIVCAGSSSCWPPMR